MRYDTPVIFQLVEEQYQTTGDYTEVIREQHTEYVSLVNTDIETMHLVYGGIRQGSLTMTLQNFVGYPFNRVVIGDKTYVVDQVVNLRVKQAYILSEWQK